MFKNILKTCGAIFVGCCVLLFVVFTVTVIKSTVWSSNKGFHQPCVAVIDIKGIIYSATSFARDLEEMLEDKFVKAILVRINSPGGLVPPSQEMYEALRKADQKIPVVVSMGSVAASGGYYAALAGRKIFANPGTATGSIGVIIELANTEGLFNWAHIKRFTLKAGKFKDIGSPFREMLPEERELMLALLENIHDQFKGAVKARRKLDDATLARVTDGRIFTGNQAKQVGLIDAIGTFQDAARETKKLAGLPDTAPLKYPQRHMGLLKRLLIGDELNDDAESLLENVAGSLSTLTYRLSRSSDSWRVLFLAPVW